MVGLNDFHCTPHDLAPGLAARVRKTSCESRVRTQRRRQARFIVLRSVRVVNLSRRRIPRIQGTSGLDTSAGVSSATPTERGRTRLPHAARHHRPQAPRMLEITTNIELSPKSHTARTQTRRITNNVRMCNRNSSGPQNVVIVSLMSQPFRAATEQAGRPPKPPPRSPGITTLRGTPAVRRTNRDTDGGGDCRAGCRMDPGGRTGPLGTPRGPGRTQTQGPRRRAHLEHVTHPASPSDEPRPVAHAPGARDGTIQGDGLDPRGRAVLPRAAHRGGAGSVRQRRQTEHGPAHGTAHSGRHRPGDQRGLTAPVHHGPDWRGHRAPLRARRRRRTPPRDDDRARGGHAVPGPGAADAAGDDGSGNRPGPAGDHRLHR